MLQLRTDLINDFGEGELLDLPEFLTAFMAVAVCGEELPLLAREKWKFLTSLELAPLCCHGCACKGAEGAGD